MLKQSQSSSIWHGTKLLEKNDSVKRLLNRLDELADVKETERGIMDRPAVVALAKFRVRRNESLQARQRRMKEAAELLQIWRQRVLRTARKRISNQIVREHRVKLYGRYIFEIFKNNVDSKRALHIIRIKAISYHLRSCFSKFLYSIRWLKVISVATKYFSLLRSAWKRLQLKAKARRAIRLGTYTICMFAQSYRSHRAYRSAVNKIRENVNKRRDVELDFCYLDSWRLFKVFRAAMVKYIGLKNGRHEISKKLSAFKKIRLRVAWRTMRARTIDQVRAHNLAAAIHAVIRMKSSLKVWSQFMSRVYKSRSAMEASAAILTSQARVPACFLMKMRRSIQIWKYHAISRSRRAGELQLAAAAGLIIRQQQCLKIWREEASIRNRSKFNRNSDSEWRDLSGGNTKDRHLFHIARSFFLRRHGKLILAKWKDFTLQRFHHKAIIRQSGRLRGDKSAKLVRRSLLLWHVLATSALNKPLPRGAAILLQKQAGDSAKGGSAGTDIWCPDHLIKLFRHQGMCVARRKECKRRSEQYYRDQMLHTGFSLLKKRTADLRTKIKYDKFHIAMLASLYLRHRWYTQCILKPRMRKQKLILASSFFLRKQFHNFAQAVGISEEKLSLEGKGKRATRAARLANRRRLFDAVVVESSKRRLLRRGWRYLRHFHATGSKISRLTRRKLSNIRGESSIVKEASGRKNDHPSVIVNGRNMRPPSKGILAWQRMGWSRLWQYIESRRMLRAAMNYGIRQGLSIVMRRYLLKLRLKVLMRQKCDQLRGLISYSIQEGWIKYKTEDGFEYYYNERTAESLWADDPRIFSKIYDFQCSLVFVRIFFRRLRALCIASKRRKVLPILMRKSFKAWKVVSASITAAPVIHQKEYRQPKALATFSDVESGDDNTIDEKTALSNSFWICNAMAKAISKLRSLYFVNKSQKEIFRKLDMMKALSNLEKMFSHFKACIRLLIHYSGRYRLAEKISNFYQLQKAIFRFKVFVTKRWAARQINRLHAIQINRRKMKLAWNQLGCS
jgi:hypothetical protein